MSNYEALLRPRRRSVDNSAINACLHVERIVNMIILAVREAMYIEENC